MFCVPKYRPKKREINKPGSVEATARARGDRNLLRGAAKKRFDENFDDINWNSKKKVTSS